MGLLDELEIRFARADDTSAMLALIRELADEEGRACELTADEASLRRSLFGVRPAAEVLIAELPPREPIGFALFFRSYSTLRAKAGLRVEDVFVRRPVRGRGIGTALMSACARIAVQRNCEMVDCSVHDRRHESARFYAGLGAISITDAADRLVAGPTLASLAARWPHPFRRG